MDDENDRHVTKKSKRHNFSLKEKTCFDIFIAPFSLVLYHLLPLLSFYTALWLFQFTICHLTEE